MNPRRSSGLIENLRSRGTRLWAAIYRLGLALVLVCLVGCAPKRNPAVSSMNPISHTDPKNDPYLWLEEVQGGKALEWVHARNRVTLGEISSDKGFAALKDRLKGIYDSKEKIPQVSKHGPHLYNFWKDEVHVRGVWRRTSLEEYRRAAPNWEIVLDLDRLAAEEKENWVWHGGQFLEPSNDRCLISLSRGGADASVTREFDVVRKEFVQGGFSLPEAKSSIAWRNRDTLYVATDFGPGSMTDSGYPRWVKEWKRGTPLASAKIVFEGKKEDVGVWPSVVHDRGFVYEFIERAPSFFTSEMWIRRGEQWARMVKPADAVVSTFGDWMLVTLRSDWVQGARTFAAGSLIAVKLEHWMEGRGEWTALFTPTSLASLAGVTGTRSYLILNILDDVRNRLEALTPGDAGWKRSPISGGGGFSTLHARAYDSDEDDRYWLTTTDFLNPPALYLSEAGREGREKIKSMPAFFAGGELRIEQFHATSKDGTRVPYFLVSRKGLKRDGSHPVILEGYGGFEIPLLSDYDATSGAAWLERGGAYAVANIRGGGEFGPKWHQAALKRNRQKAYDDFIAVAEDLVKSRMTSPRQLGIIGGSNGGLLMGNMLVQRPDLFGAIVCQVPLLDMYRYNKLLAGASWMEEFGNPDQAEEWEFLRNYSPYHQVRPGIKYPRVLFTTSTRDDRVHPGHARKMVARMMEQGHDVLYYENVEGGHGGAANNDQRSLMNSLAFTFFQKELGLSR